MSSAVLQTCLIRRNWVPILLQCLCALKTRTSQNRLLTMGRPVKFNCGCDVHCHVQSLQRRGQFDSTWATLPCSTEFVVTEDVELTVFLGAAWNGGSVVTGYVALVPWYRSSLKKCS